MVRPLMLLLVLVVELSLAQDIVPVRTGNGPTPPPGGRRRKDPTADLPDLSRDELLAILDLIEKSGDSSGKSPVGTPTRSPTPISIPSRPPTAAPTIRPRVPSLYPEIPDISAPELPPRPHPTHTPTPYSPTPQPPTPFNYPREPTDPHYPYRPTPPNFPAPTAPPAPNYPAPPPPTTPKPKKSLFDKILRGIMKLVAPQTAVNSRSAVPASGSMNFLESFLNQLQHVHQSSQNGQQRSVAGSTQQVILDNLVKRLQGQNTEGSQFVVNLVHSLKNANNPMAAPTGPVNARTGGQTEQLLGALLKGMGSPSTQSGQAGSGNTGGAGGLFDAFQRELVRAYNPSAGPTGQRTTSDVLLEGFKQFLQKQGN